MRITVKLFALLSGYLPDGAKDHAAELEVPDGATARDVIERLNLPERLTHLVLVNGVYVAPSEREKARLKAGDVLAVWPPIAGG